MRLQQALQLRGRHVLLPLLPALLCVSAGSAESGCEDPDLNITRAVGEQWLLPNCGGLATCSGRPWGLTVTVDSCPESDYCKKLDDGDPSAAFPRCCPRFACEFCRSEALGRDFPPGSAWTDGHCVRHQCKLGPSGSLERRSDACEPLGPPPSLDCQVVDQDMARGEYPLCCAHYRCPGLCRSGESWKPVGAVRADSCDASGAQPAGRV